MTKSNLYRTAIWLTIAICFTLVGSYQANAQTSIDPTTLLDPLHGFCWGGTPACVDNGTNTPTTTNPPNFGFTISPAAKTGDFLIDVLVPNNEVAPASFSVTGTQGGATNTLALSGTATLVSATAWTSGDLAAYLGFSSSSPNNPIGAYLPSTQALEAAATGFLVFQVDLGTNHIMGNPDFASGPLLNISGSLPKASYIVGFLNTGTTASPDYVATANSGAIFEKGAPTPEPASMLLIGTGLVAFGSMLRRKKVNA